QSAAVTKQKIQQLEGIWWDSQRRLPDKWLLLKRDYRLGYELQPNYPNAPHVLHLQSTFDDGEPIAAWLTLRLLSAAPSESAFAGLLAQVPLGEVWSPSQFPLFADYAEQQDRLEQPKQQPPQVERHAPEHG
ncbi:MAG: DUF4056 domain-containing protein, partial [Shewanella sp.]